VTERFATRHHDETGMRKLALIVETVDSTAVHQTAVDEFTVDEFGIVYINLNPENRCPLIVFILGTFLFNRTYLPAPWELLCPLSNDPSVLYRHGIVKYICAKIFTL